MAHPRASERSGKQPFGTDEPIDEISATTGAKTVILLYPWVKNLGHCVALGGHAASRPNFRSSLGLKAVALDTSGGGQLVQV